jgi:hypothetical protein
MSLKVTGTRQLFTAPKGEKGDKGEDGNSFTPKGQAKGHFNSSDEFDEDSSEKPYGSKYLVDDEEGGTAKVYTIAARRIGIADANEGDAYTIDNTKHLWAATGHKWVDFGEIQGPKGDNGNDGNDAELYRLQLTAGWARWEKQNSGWRLKCCIKGNAWFIKGSKQIAATSGTGYEEQRICIKYDNNRQIHYLPIAGDGSWTDDANGKYLEDNEYGSYYVGQPESIIVELIGKDVSDHTQVLDSLTIAIAWDGEPGGKGNDGNPGPMGIPTGEYNSSATYERTNEIVPIVEHNGEYWYPRNKGVLTNSEPSANNSNWKKAENFEVMFVKILFAAFAKLGEAIFHGNFMFSQNGKVNGADSNNYQLFSPSDPDNEGNASRFAPNLYLNFLSGAARLAGGKAMFNPDGSGSLAGGRIEWDAVGLKMAGISYKKKTVITRSNLSQYTTVVGTFVKDGETQYIYALDVLKAGTWIELNGIRPGVCLKLPSMYWDGTYTEAEKNLARSLVGSTIIINTVDTPLCDFRDTHMRFYEWVDIMGNRYYVDDDGNNTADTTFSQDFTVYLECVLADVRDSNGRYREDIRWDARVVMENS